MVRYNHTAVVMTLQWTVIFYVRRNNLCVNRFDVQVKKKEYSFFVGLKNLHGSIKAQDCKKLSMHSAVLDLAMMQVEDLSNKGLITQLQSPANMS